MGEAGIRYRSTTPSDSRHHHEDNRLLPRIAHGRLLHGQPCLLAYLCYLQLPPPVCRIFDPAGRPVDVAYLPKSAGNIWLAQAGTGASLLLLHTLTTVVSNLPDVTCPIRNPSQRLADCF